MRLNERYIYLLIIAIFFISGLIGIMNHELWRDELEIWLIAKESSSIPDLISNMYTETHPALWYILNFFITIFTDNPFYMQLLNLLLGTTAVYIIIRYAPFDLLLKILLAFSYFLFYEYSIIARCYSLEFLLIFLFCVLYKKRHQSYLLISLILFFLANTNLYGVIIAANLGLFLLLEILFKKKGSQPFKINKTGFASLFIFFAGITIGFGDIISQTLEWGYFSSSMPGTAPVKNFQWMAQNIAIIFHGYFPFPDFSAFHFWNTSILTMLPDELSMWLGLFLGLLLYVYPIFLFLKRPLLLTLYFLSTFTMLILIAFIWHGQLRHHGHIFLMFIVCYWLSFYIDESTSLKNNGTMHIKKMVSSIIDFTYKIKTTMLTLILSVQLFTGTYAYAMDLKYPFSNAEKASTYLLKEEFNDLLLVGSRDFAVQPITYYINKKIFYPESKKFGTYVIWSKDRNNLVGPSNAIEDAISLLTNQRKNFLIIISHNPYIINQNISYLNKTINVHIGEEFTVRSGINLKYLANIEGAIVKDENYYLFLLYKAE
ncbi:MAG: hypothetical protein FVQ77_12615 [Cytophagales bacterium]|nr:hypothetical protein [Cytophagales bacterium]